MRSLILTTVAIAIVVGCDSGEPHPDSSGAATQPSNSAARLAGFWRSQPYLTQLGCARDELCLLPDHSFRFAFRSQAAVLSTAGSYSLAKGSLLLQSDDSRPAMTLSLEHGSLVRALENGRKIVFNLADSRCAPPDERRLTPSEEEAKACFE